MSKRCPCYHCEKRHLACHENCEDYMVWRKKRHDYLKRNEADNFTCENVAKIMTFKNKRRRH